MIINMKANASKQKENIFDLYQQNPLLSFKNQKLEEEYSLHVASNNPSNVTTISGILLLVTLCILLISFSQPAFWASSVALILLSAFSKLPILKRLPQYFLVFIFQLHIQDLGNATLLLDFTLHLLFTTKLRDFFIISLLKELSFSLVSNRILDYALMSLVLLLLKKDLRDFWILNNYFISLTKESEKLLNSINTGYLITDEHGEILEKNPIGEKILSLRKASVLPNRVQDLFSPDYSLRLLRMIEKAQKGYFPEEEFLYIFTDSSDHSPFASMLIKIIPMSNRDKNSFLLILKDITRFIITRTTVAYTFNQNSSLFHQFDQLLIDKHTTSKSLTEEDKTLILTFFGSQLELGVMIGWVMGATELKLSSFLIKPEVINIIHLCWGKWINKGIKINFLCEKDVPCVRSDNAKHNQLLNAMLEYILYQVDERSEILITISRSVRSN